MKLRVVYWVVGLSLAGFLYWQHSQEQQRIQLQLQLLEATVQVANERAAADAANILYDMRQAIELNRNQLPDLLLMHSRKTFFNALTKKLSALTACAAPC